MSDIAVTLPQETQRAPFSERLCNAGLPALHILASTVGPVAEGLMEGRSLSPRKAVPAFAWPATMLAYMAGSQRDMQRDQAMADCVPPSRTYAATYRGGTPFAATILYHISYDLGALSARLF